MRGFMRGFVITLLLAGMMSCGDRPEEESQVFVAPTAVKETVVFGRIPADNPLDMLDRMEPFLKHLKEKLDVEIEVRFAKDYEDFTNEMVRGAYDLAFCAPFQYISAKEKAGYEAVLKPQRYGADTYVGIIITANSAVTSLGHLRGRKVAFADPGSTSGYIFPLGLLMSEGIKLDDIESKFVGGHDNVVLNVQRGNYDAGACYQGAVERFADKNGRQIRVIGRTLSISNEPIAISPKFRKERPEMAEKVVEAIKRMNETPEGEAALKAFADGIKKFVSAADGDYDSVRQYRAALPPEVIRGQ